MSEIFNKTGIMLKDVAQWQLQMFFFRVNMFYVKSIKITKYCFLTFLMFNKVCRKSNKVTYIIFTR